jgi:cobaltochelatase CobN
MNSKKKYILIVLSVLLLVIAGWIIWQRTASPTRIALLNFQPFQVSNISLSNEDKFILDFHQLELTI